MKRFFAPMLPAAALLAFGLSPALAAKHYDRGASDGEIVVGQTMPYSGPVSAYATIGKVEAAYFRMINSEGGINGRKIKLLSLDDGYSPPKTVERARELVEADGVLLLFNPLGTPTNTAIHEYLNKKEVPQLFVATGATKWGDPKHFPWTMGWQPSYQEEGHIYARYILSNKPNAKIGILYQNDDYGRDYVKGLKDGLGDKAAKMIVAEATYEVTDPTIESQILSLKSSGADVFYDVTTPKFAAQAIRSMSELDWHPLHVLNSVSASVAAVFEPAGMGKSKGIVSLAYLKDPTDPQWKNDKGVLEWLAFMRKWYPEGSTEEAFNVYGYSIAQTLVQVLKQCGDDLTRANIMKQAAHLDMTVPMLLPGISIKTGPDDFYPIQSERLERFDGQRWQLFGKILAG